MKLYTEEQVKEAYNKGRTDWINEIEDNNILYTLIPIELPSDEEIEKAANSKEHYEGAMWLKYKILNQNNQTYNN